MNCELCAYNEKHIIDMNVEDKAKQGRKLLKVIAGNVAFEAETRGYDVMM